MRFRRFTRDVCFSWLLPFFSFSRLLLRVSRFHDDVLFELYTFRNGKNETKFSADSTRREIEIFSIKMEYLLKVTISNNSKFNVTSSPSSIYFTKRKLSTTSYPRGTIYCYKNRG